MRTIRKLSRYIASAMFTAALGDTFDWVQSVPAGPRPRYSPAKAGEIAVTDAPAGWDEGSELKPLALSR